MSIVELHKVCFKYSNGFEINDLDIHIEKGEIFALLGPNGAGKTTTIRLINGLLQPFSGRVRVFGKDPSTEGNFVRAQTGVLTETPGLYERLSVVDNLTFFGMLLGIKSESLQLRIKELLDFFDLSKRSNDKVGKLSRGMRQRLAIARAILHRPSILFLDEPTSNLDPEIARHVNDLIIQVRDFEQCSVVISTHRLQEIERICDRVAIMNFGHVLAQGSLTELRQKVSPGCFVSFRFFDQVNDISERNIKSAPLVISTLKESKNEYVLEIKSLSVIPDLIAYFVSCGIQISAVIPREISLEEVYFRTQGKSEKNYDVP